MKIAERIGSFFGYEPKEKNIDVNAFNGFRTSGSWGRGYAVSFDGEKNPGEIGPVLDYKLDYQALSARSWQAYLESEIAKTVLNRFSVWVVASGLKLQCSPSKTLLESEGINIDSEKFNTNVEALFNLWVNSKKSSYNGESNLKELSKEVFKHSKVGGDCLVILRYEKGCVNVEVVDTYHLSSFATLKDVKTGNKIKNGIEIDERGKHIAYHVSKEGNTQRIPAYNKQGLRIAFLVYGSKYRYDNTRGLPVIGTSLETMKKIERYKEAAVGSAEERAKIPYSIEHNQFSEGENPLADSLAKVAGYNNSNDAVVPVDQQGEALANTVAATMNKTVLNMPIGSTIKSLESKNEMFFKDFYGTNADIICAAVGIPPNVAFSMYNDSFSASRAATKDWEHTINVERDSFQDQFYNRVFAFWFHIEVLKNKINAPGYLLAFNTDNWVVTESYLKNRFTGPMFPHIDPLKEVKAEREKLGELGKHIPLTTIERATEALASGESTSNLEQFSEEIKKANSLGLTASVELPNDD